MRIQNPREVYGRTLVEIGRENPNVVVLEADLGKSTMSCYFEQAFPERFFEMGIAEANMTSFAAGLSLTGKIPFTNSFAVFAGGAGLRRDPAGHLHRGTQRADRRFQLRAVRFRGRFYASVRRGRGHYAGDSKHDGARAGRRQRKHA